MGEKGIMLYGYGGDDAGRIKEALDASVGADLEMISGSGREHDRVMDVLEDGPGGPFSDGGDKVLMVLGFSDDDLERALKGFPSEEGVQRPIFCVLTPHNAGWSLQELVDDLKREREAFARMRAGGPGGGGG